MSMLKIITFFKLQGYFIVTIDNKNIFHLQLISKNFETNFLIIFRWFIRNIEFLTPSELEFFLIVINRKTSRIKLNFHLRGRIIGIV